MAADSLLVGDIGGTNARFALGDAESARYSEERVLQCVDFESPEAAIEDYLAQVQVEKPEAICLAAAGPVADGAIDLTNNNWHLRESSLSSRFGTGRVRLLNDFEAVAFSLPFLTEDECIPIGLRERRSLDRPNWTVGVIGPGTGLGAAGLMSRGGHRVALVSEAGHVGFAPENAMQRAVWEVLRHRFGRVSDERLLSGAGLENIFTALSEIHGEPSPVMKAATIFDAVGQNTLATESVILFFEILGQVAGNFALSIGAYDGIYIGGGIVQRYPALLANSTFRSSFENKGRHRHIMERIPTLLISHPHPGLIGAAVVAGELLHQR